MHAKLSWIFFSLATFSSSSCRSAAVSESTSNNAEPSGIYGDYNRNGLIDDGDKDSGLWDWKTGGAFMMADIVDANKNKIPDSMDPGPRTLDMLKQFVPLRIDRPGTFKFTHNGGQHVLVYTAGGSAEVKSESEIEGPTTLMVAAKYFAGMNSFSGYVNFRIENAKESHNTTFRVAPWIMLPNAAVTKKLYIADGAYRDAHLLKESLEPFVKLQVYRTSMWQEMWMQDTMEIGYQEVPGKGIQYAALQADRCTDTPCDHFAPTLLSETFGVFRVTAHPRKGYGNWDDWYGNLEVSPATPKWPLGRIYFGKNLNENLASILRQQEVQSPFVIDPTWLLIKHVDEFLNFVVDGAGRAKMIVASPQLASKLNGTPLTPENAQIQVRIDRDVNLALEALGMSTSDVIRFPVLYAAGGENLWSSPINSVHLNRTVAVGNTGQKGPGTLKSSPYGKSIEEGFAQAGIKTLWVDDRAYQPNHGNVHCGTNTLKEPAKTSFWTLVPNR